MFDPSILWTLHFERLWVFYLIPIMMVLLIVLLWINFVPLKNLSEKELKQRKRRRLITRIFLLITRILIFTSLLVALAGPYYEDEILVDGNPRVTVLKDVSNSMNLFDQSEVSPLIAELKKRVPVEEYTIGSGEESELGHGIIAHMADNNPMLLITDGQTTGGTSLLSVAQFAGNVNSSLSGLVLPVQKNDVSVTVLGPSKSLEDVENSFTARVTSQEPTSFTLRVTIDGQQVLRETRSTKADTPVDFPFEAKFQDGHHVITATVSATENTFSENDVFRKTVHIVEKPKVLVVTPFQTQNLELLKKIYDVTVLSDIPQDLEDYGALVMHDVEAKKISNEDVNLLTDYLNEGNGIVALGGLNSFDLGKYEESSFESLLPVRTGSGEDREGDSFVVLLLDISKSTRGGFRSASKYSVSDVIKAQAIAMLDTLHPKDNVAVVAFNDRAYLISHMSPLEDKQTQLVDKIARLKFANTTYMNVGLMASYQLLREQSGSKSIVVLSDGRVSGYSRETTALVQKMGSGNIHTYTVGVGGNTDRDYMKELARVGKGIYFEPSEFQKLKILFGEPELLKTEGKAELIILNADHFITRGLELTGRMGAYNSIVPKSTAQVLVTLETGEPAVTVWRQGLGRVAAVNVFTTNNDLGPLLEKDNSKIVTRIMNWAIGDPERNSEYYVLVDDTNVGVSSAVRVRSEKVPSANGILFSREGPKEYSSSFEPKEQGVFPILTTTYAVNAPLEYTQVGLSTELEEAVFESGGKFFQPEDVTQIVEFLKAESRRTQIERINYGLPLILFAMGVFLLEILIRRIYDMWRMT